MTIFCPTELHKAVDCNVSGEEIPLNANVIPTLEACLDISSSLIMVNQITFTVDVDFSIVYVNYIYKSGVDILTVTFEYGGLEEIQGLTTGISTNIALVETKAVFDENDMSLTYDWRRKLIMVAAFTNQDCLLNRSIKYETSGILDLGDGMTPKFYHEVNLEVSKDRPSIVSLKTRYCEGNSSNISSNTEKCVDTNYDVSDNPSELLAPTINRGVNSRPYNLCTPQQFEDPFLQSARLTGAVKTDIEGYLEQIGRTFFRNQS